MRPPYGYESSGRTPFQQCEGFDTHFTDIALEVGGVCAYVNRAFAYAIKNHASLALWGSDNAHTSELGAYLVASVMFTTIYGISATELDKDSLSATDAALIQSIADKIALAGYNPF